MKTLHVINGLGTGGAERSLAELVADLPSHGITPVIACIHSRVEGVQESVLRSGVVVRFLSAGNTAARVRALRALIREERPALVHTTIFDADVVGRLAAVGGPPVLTSLVNTSYDRTRLRADPTLRWWRLVAARELDGWTARRLTRHFHAITRVVADIAVRDLRIPPDRITVIERGRDPQRLGIPSPRRRNAARAQLGLDGATPVVVNVGRQEYQKGHRTLVEALARLTPGHPDIVLLQAGRDGNATADLLRRIAQLEVSAHIRQLGHVDDVPNVLVAGDVFAFPSEYEGLGGSLIEALALGLPIVASDLPVIREIVPPGAAVLVPAGDPRQLADAISALLHDPARRAEMGAHGRAAFEARFTADRVHARMAELFWRVAAASKSDLETAQRASP